MDSKQRCELGRLAESEVCRFLQSNGWQVVARNLRVGRLELDIVARRESLISVVEVRYRGPGSWASAFGSINREKRRRVRLAGQRLWQRRYASDASVERLRFDAASVTFDTDGLAHVEYVPAAF